MLIVGLMSGTSTDGIDAALVDVSGAGRGVRASVRAFTCVPHTNEMRAAILALCDAEGGRVPDLCALSFALGERFAEAARAVADIAGTPLADVAAIASHGQTVWHQPEPRTVGGAAATGTLQIGDPAVIAARTGVRVVSGFRSADMAAGGQGAPLVPYADWALLTSDTQSRAVQNIGGIANVTYLPAGARLDDVIAFDTGPGNVLIDGVVRRFTGGSQTRDGGGSWAASGRVQPGLLKWVLAHPFFAAPPPKSTGRELFSPAYVDALLREAANCCPRTRDRFEEDVLATVTAATAESIGRAYRTWLAPRGGVDEVIVGGGGTHNATLMAALRAVVAPARVTIHADHGIDDDAKEALAFALLAHETLNGRPANVPGATGASRRVVLGSITPAPASPR